MQKENNRKAIEQYKIEGIYQSQLAKDIITFAKKNKYGISEKTCIKILRGQTPSSPETVEFARTIEAAGAYQLLSDDEIQRTIDVLAKEDFIARKAAYNTYKNLYIILTAPRGKPRGFH